MTGILGPGRGTFDAASPIAREYQEEIKEKKWADARIGQEGPPRRNAIPKSQRPDGTVAGSTKKLASKFYQLKTGHARTGQSLHWAKVCPTAQCWWCKGPTETRDHFFKVCPEWKGQQKILWAEVRKETEVEEPVEDQGSACQWEVWPGGARFPFIYGCGEADAGYGRGCRRGE